MHLVELELSEGSHVFVNAELVTVLRPQGPNTQVEFDPHYSVLAKGAPTQVAAKLNRP